MFVRELEEIIKDCNKDSSVVIFALTEDDVYRPFRNIEANIFNKSAFNEELHLDISINKEYRSIHFPNNRRKEDIEDLLEKRDMLLEELQEINELIGKEL